MSEQQDGARAPSVRGTDVTAGPPDGPTAAASGGKAEGGAHRSGDPAARPSGAPAGPVVARPAERGTAAGPPEAGRSRPEPGPAGAETVLPQGSPRPTTHKGTGHKDADAPTAALRTGPATAGSSAGAAGGAAGGSTASAATTEARRPPARPPLARPEGSRPAGPARPSGGARPGAATRPAGRSRRARLAVTRVDPWSVFVFSLLGSVFLGIVLVVAVTALYFVLSSVGVLDSVNGVVGEVTGDAGPDAVQPPPLITAGRVLSLTAVLAALDVVILTALATLSALLYNLCASLTGGIEVTLGERE